MSDIKETKTARKGIVVVLGIICIILIAGLGGTIAVYTLMIKDKNGTISSLRSQISQLDSDVTNLEKQVTSDNFTINSLTSQVTNLQKQVNDLLNASYVSVDEITANASAWVNKTVVVEGNISLNIYTGWWWAPWNYELSSNGTTIGVSWPGNLSNGKNVLVLGVVTGGQWTEMLANGTVTSYGSVVYFIEAERIDI
jgi:flagellar basal body-associated protein FliL